jgi:FixJ family two-component response regulator
VTGDDAFSLFVDAPKERAGTLILRVWVESGGLRARILRSIGSHQAPPIAVTGADDVHMAVQAWIDELLEPGG